MVGVNPSHSMMSEVKEIRDYTDKQELRCLGLLSRLSRIQIDIVESHAEEQFSSLISQPQNKFGITRPRSRSNSMGQKSDMNRAEGYSISIPPPPQPSSSLASFYHPQSFMDTLPSVITKAKEPKRRRKNPLHDTPLWKIPEIADIQRVGSTLRSVFRQSAIGNLDLDETESSSGDSSCDETSYVHEDSLGNPRRLTHYLPVEENPAYKFAADRSKVIAMWTWLQDAIANLSYRIKQQDEFAKHLALAKPPFQFEEHPTHLPHRVSSSRTPSNNAALKDACIQIFTANNNSQIPPTSTQVFYAGERKSSYITDSSGKIIQLVPPPQTPGSSTKGTHVATNGDSKAVPSTSSSNYPHQDRNSIVGGGLESLGLTIPINHDPSCTARRCMPLKPFKQRKIYQLGGIHNMSSFAGRAPTLLCNCFARSELCAVCTGRARKTKLIEVDVMDTKEIHELLDHNYHRTLSLPDETPMPALVESALKREGWTGRRSRKKMKFKRLYMNWAKQRAHLGRDSELLSEAGKKRARGRPRLPRSVDQYGHVVIKHPKPLIPIKKPNWRKEGNRGSLNRRASYGGDMGFNRSFKFGSRKKYNSVSSAKSLRGKRNGGVSDDDGLFDSDFPNYDEFMNDNFPNKSDKRFSQSGRKLNQDYDIDNIVIPYSIASSTRVEKIEYKEILTPSWRLVPDIKVEEELTETLESDEDQETMKDLSEEAIKVRHDRCEVDEHKKFNSIPDKSSRRGRRLDSRTESLELPLSNPSSPGTVETVEAVCPSPPTVISGDDPSSEMLGPLVLPRRRTISSTSRKDEDEVDDQRVETDWGVRAIPFEPRKFPLTEDEYQEMNKDMPETEPEDDVRVRPHRISPTVGIISEDADLLKDVDGEGDDLVEMEDSGDEDDPDWHIAPGERDV